MGKKTWGIITLCTLGSAGLVWGTPPQRSIQNAVVQEISAAAGLRTEVQRLAKQRQDPFWIGYEVPLVSGIGGICSPSDSAYKLERDSEQVFQSRQGDRSPHPDLMVLLRVHQGKVSQIRSLTTDCSLDAGGLPVFWLQNVGPGDSVALLSSFVRPQASEEMAHAAVFAIGAHADKAADEALVGFIRTGTPEIRSRVLGRLGNARGRFGFEAVRDLLLAREENSEVRQQALFAIAMSHEPEAEDVLLQFAREDQDVAVRSRALFLYAGEAGHRALPVLSEAMADPNREIRSTAVEALRHLPEPERREILEGVAKQNVDPEVRRQAEFMLERMDGRESLPPTPPPTRRPNPN